MNRGTSGIAATSIAALLVTGCASPFYMGQQSSAKHRPVARTVAGPFASIETVSVRADLAPPTLTVTGDFGKETQTAGEGAKAGAKAGASAVTTGAGEAMLEDPRMILLAPILPFAIIAGSIAGSIAGATAAKIEQQVQKFRDGLTEDIQATAEAASLSDRFASVVNGRLERNPRIESTLAETADELPADVDAVIDLIVSGVTVDTHEKYATIYTKVTISITGADGTVLARQHDEYSEEDRLSDWTADADARWTEYQEGAWQYFARRIARQLYNPIELRHVLRPVESERDGFLDWELILLGEAEENAWANAITESDARFNLEIYDGSRLAFSTDGLSDTHYAITTELEPCTTYTWSVRPVYHFEGILRAGEWMGYESANRRRYATGQSHPTAPALPPLPSRRVTEGLPKIETRCQ